MDKNVSLEDMVEFAENPEPRCPCVLLLDTSGSMRGERIKALQEGIDAFHEQLQKDSLAASRVELSVLSFSNDVKLIQDFITIDHFNGVHLEAHGLTHMGEGIQVALDMVEERKKTYKANGIAYYRPWIFMITDGEPQGESSDVIEQASQRLQNAEANKSVAFFAVGVEEANMSKLSQISVRDPLKLKGLNFVELFVWLSTSMQAVSHSRVGDQVALPPAGWAAV